jgi:hypothetical protein
MAKFNLEQGEKELHNQTLFYEPQGGGKFNGKMVVTDRKLLYDAKYDMSLKGMISESLFMKWGSEGFLTIPKSEIVNVEVQKSFLAKKVILTLKDGSKHTFNAGMLSVDKLAEALKN